MRGRIRATSRKSPLPSDASFPVCKKAGRMRLADYAVLLLCMVVLPAGVIHGLLGLDERAVFALVTPVVLYFYLNTCNFRVQKSIPTLALALILTGVVASIVSMSMSQLLMGTALAVAVLVGRQLFLTLSKPGALRVVSWFALTLLVGGVIGVIYAMIGGEPLLDVRVGYRTTHLYLTTFSFAFIGEVIRPSGIFDEPGAFAMYVAILTMFNDTFRQNRRLNHALVVMLIFTGALAGLVMSILYLLCSNALRMQRTKSILLVGVMFAGIGMVSFVVPSNPLAVPLDTFYSDRLRIDDGKIVGDNRSNQVADFFQVVDSEVLLKGATGRYETYDTEDQSSNPFSIIFGYGFIMWVPYFILLLWLLATTIQSRFRNAYMSIGLFLLLLQRPYLYNMAWSVLIVATVWLCYTAARQRPKRTISTR